MGLKFWYVAESHHVYQIREFLTKKKFTISDLQRILDFNQNLSN